MNTRLKHTYRLQMNMKNVLMKLRKQLYTPCNIKWLSSSSNIMIMSISYQARSKSFDSQIRVNQRVVHNKIVFP